MSWNVGVMNNKMNKNAASTVLLALAIAAVVGFVLWAFATGPSVLEIIDNPRF